MKENSTLQELGDKEAFQKGFNGAYGDTSVKFWPNCLHAAKPSYKEGGKDESIRLSWLEASKFARAMLDGMVSDVCLKPEDRGKLVAATKRPLEALMGGVNSRKRIDSDGPLFLERVGGLTILGVLPKYQATSILSSQEVAPVDILLLKEMERRLPLS